MSKTSLRGPLGAAAALALTLAAGAAHADGDAAHGKQVFALCSGCHVLTGPGFAAPPLAGGYGRKAATAAGYTYSTALKGSGLVWGDDTLDRFLTAPGTLVPGTTMLITVPDAKDRADVIAYLKTIPAPAP